MPEIVMTSFPARIKTLRPVNRELCEMDEMLLQNANIKSGSAFQKTNFLNSSDAPSCQSRDDVIFGLQ